MTKFKYFCYQCETQLPEEIEHLMFCGDCSKEEKEDETSTWKPDWTDV